MGNHHSQGGSIKQGHEDSTPDGPQSGTITQQGSKKEKSISRSASGADIQEKYSTQLVPVEKLSKILLKRSQEEDHVQGITCNAFSKYVFPRYPALAEKIFQYLHKQAKAHTDYLGGTAFRQQVEKFLGLMDDETILNLYVRMYSVPDSPKHCDSNNIFMTTDSLRLLLFTAYRVAMDHYSEGPQMCLHIQKTLTTVVESCFHGKTKLSSQFVCNWLLTNCPRLILPLHRYAVHLLATAYRTLDTENSSESSLARGIELATPVLEQLPPFPSQSNGSSNHQHYHLMPMSTAWLLAGALDPVYSRPRASLTPTHSNSEQRANCSQTSLSGGHGQLFLARIAGAVPSHWIMLYNSDTHGQGANRFLHHVLAYRGPTLILFRADNGSVYCITSTIEWHESHLYWGTEESAIVELQPKFSIIEKGAKILYLNTTIRGYPQGLRAGKDPRKPVIIIDGGFEKIEYKTIPYSLTNIEVWGCGDPTQRETQLDIKKWQVKEAERQRKIKLSAADWLDHPDRYLLELAGRPQYSNTVATNNSSAQAHNQT